MLAQALMDGLGAEHVMDYRLLILACSQRKNNRSGAVAPSDLYDGPAWRTLRAYLAHRDDPQLTVLALSARYGILNAQHDRIETYDQRLTLAQASDPQWVAQYVTNPLANQREVLDARILHGALPVRVPIAIIGGRAYRQALAHVPWRPADSVFTASGGIGQQLHQLKIWLHAEP